MPSLLEVLYVSVALLAIVPITLYLRDRKTLYKLAERLTPENMVTEIKKAYPLEDLAKVGTAVAVNSMLTLSRDEDFAPKVMNMTKQVVPLAVQAYIQTPHPNPGQALAEQRWGPSRGNAPVKMPSMSDGWEGIIQGFVQQYAQNMMGNMLSGGGPSNGGGAPQPGASPASQSTALWRPPV